jgi:hypothetical protein
MESYVLTPLPPNVNQTAKWTFARLQYTMGNEFERWNHLISASREVLVSVTIFLTNRVEVAGKHGLHNL